MFVKKFDRGDFVILLLYVDDMVIVERDRIKIGMLKKVLSMSFSMKDMGPARSILGMHIVWDRTKKLLWLSLNRYVTKLLQRFSMVDAKLIRSTLSEGPSKQRSVGRVEEISLALGEGRR